MRKQQIQQMSSQSEDNGLNILFKFKHLIFPQIQEQEHIINIIQQEPLKTIDKVLMAITQYYSEKLAEIIEPLEDDKNHLLNRLQETKQKLQHSLEDNQHFKNIIDKLEEEKKDIESQLNQSHDDIERSYQQYETVVGERQKIKSQAKGIYESYQFLLAENSQLKNIHFQYQKQMINIKEQITNMAQTNKNYQLDYKRLELEKQKIQQQNCKLKQQNDAFLLRMNQKQQFIASFVSDYNKLHYFQRQQDSFNQTQKKAIDTSKDSDNNQLKGFNFNDFDKESIKSEKSSRKSQAFVSSKEKSNLKQGEIDQKYLFVNATAQKLKIPITFKITGSENKHKGEGIAISIQKKDKKESQKNATAKIIFETSIQSKKLSKAESSKNLHKQSIVALSDTQELKINIEQVLRKKLLEKNVRIGRLQHELNNLKIKHIQQRQNITEMQGSYEIQISQLKQEITYLKTQLNTLYRKYVLANSQCVKYQEKVAELQSQLAGIDEEHQLYCEQLKRRCKLYIIKKLDQAQVHYETIRSYEFSTKKKQQPERQYKSIRRIQKFYTEERYNDQDHQDVKESLSLKLHEDNQQSEDIKKEDGTSDIYSYQHVDNHYINGLGFDLQLSITNKNNDRETIQEIYVKENFQIQSDLGGFTERLMEKNKEISKQRGNLTDRVAPKLLKSMFDIKTRNKYTLESGIFNINVDPQPKNIGYYHLQELIIYPSRRKMQNSLQFNVKVFPLKKEINLSSKTVNINHCPSKKIHQILSELCLKVEPFKFETNLKLCKLQNLIFFGKQKHLKLQSKIFTLKQYEKEQSKISVSTQTETQSTDLSQLRKKSNLSIIRINQFDFCYKHLKQSNISQYIVSQQSRSQGQFQQLSQVRSFPEVDNNSEKCLIVSRLDQFISNETEQKKEEKNNYQYNAKQKYQHVRYESAQYQQVIIKQKKSDKKIEQTKNQKVEDLEQQSRIKQKTTASTVQTNTQWYQEKKQNHIQNSPIEKNSFYQQSKKVNLNKAMILSNINSQKAESQKHGSCFNPESKHNRAVTQVSDFHITPWFIDNKKHVIVNNQMISLEGLPIFLIDSMKTQILVKLGKFIKENRIVVKFLQQVKLQSFKKPLDMTKKIIVLQTNNKQGEQTFLLANKFLYRLDDMAKITINGQRFINQLNFNLGQAEIIITKHAQLIINRKNKVMIMPGNIEDGAWIINSYSTFEYRSKKN